MKLEIAGTGESNHAPLLIVPADSPIDVIIPKIKKLIINTIKITFIDFIFTLVIIYRIIINIKIKRLFIKLILLK